MEQHLSNESLQLIANLINDKNADLKEHFDVQLRMVKTTVQENHNLASETVRLQNITNGRVNKIEDALYGVLDSRGNVVAGKEGIVSDVGKIKKWSWLYSDWRVAAILFAITTAVYVKESRDFIITILDKIF